jgi:hypothetical protein
MWVTGTPHTQRRFEADRRRVTDLRQIAFAMNLYQRQQTALPPSLAEPSIRQRLGTNAVTDPETGVPYQYRPLGQTKYQLCATFDAVSATEASFWNHPAGFGCFELDAGQRAPL